MQPAKGGVMATKEDDIRVLKLWKQRLSPGEIAKVTGKPIGVIYQQLRVLQKELVRQQGVENHETKIHT
jgi:hypothetical protein